MKITDKLLLVIVLYKSNLFDTNTYRTLIKHNPNFRLFVYDNSPRPMHSQTDFVGNVHYVSDTCNSGLSVAYNQGAKYAVEQGLKWMLILDQDTIFAPDVLLAYWSAVVENPLIKLVVAPMQINDNQYMSPVRVRNHSARLATKVPLGIVSSREYAPINSGMMINVDTFIKVGGYNEAVWLDHSDYQFMERFKRFYGEFYVIEVVCRQEFSDKVQSSDQKIKRFEIFCQCLKNCEKPKCGDHFSYLYIVLKRALSLVISTKRLAPITVLIKNYFK